jgi:hypothetical protein
MGTNLKRGAAAGAGNTKPEERIFLWMKASKSKASSVAAGFGR